jgi:transcriptional regulatory protein GAL4
MPFLHSKKRSNAVESRASRASQESLHNAGTSFIYGLNTSAVEEQLVSLYFTGYNVSYPIIHERTFRDQWSRRSQIAANSHWHIIYYMVLAIGEWIGGFSSDATSIYYEAARSRLRIEVLESGSVSIVQAFLLMGNYLQKRDRPNTGYNFIGIAYRVALGLGLHREVSPDRKMASFTLQQRRLLFWTLYCFESGFSITTGRPILVSDSFIDIHKPQNVDDSLAIASSALPAEVDYPTTCSAIIAQARLALIANKVYNDFLSTRTCTDVNHHIAIVEQRINNWRSSLPSFFVRPDVPKWFLGPRQVVIWKEANIRILLLLAGERHHTEEHDKAATGTKCQLIAIEAIFDIADFCQKHADVVHMGLSWYAVYFLLQAILALGMHEQKKPDRPASRSASLERRTLASEQCQTAVSRAWKCLEGLGPRNKAAVRTMHILERLFDGTRVSDTEPEGNTSTLPFAPASVRASAQIGVDEQRQSSLDNFPPAANDEAIGGNFGEFPVPTGIDPFSGPSPNDIIATDFVENEWVGTVDPSLHMFFDNSHNIDEIFHGVQGFPSTIEHDNFDYMTSSMQTVRSAFSKSQSQSSASAAGEPSSWSAVPYLYGSK